MISNEERNKIIEQAKQMAIRNNLDLDILKEKKTNLELITKKTFQEKRVNEEVKIKLKSQNYLDIRTGLKNNDYQRLVFPKIYESLKQKDIPLSILSASIDDYNKIENYLDDNICSKVLRLTASSIKKSIRGTDEASYVGGHNFTILIPGEYEIGVEVGKRMIKEQQESIIYIKDDLEKITNHYSKRRLIREIYNNPDLLYDKELANKLKNNKSLIKNSNFTFQVKKDSNYKELLELYNSKNKILATFSIGVIQAKDSNNYQEAFIKANKARFISEKKHNTITLSYDGYFIPLEKINKLL